MKIALSALLFLPLLATASVAETAERATFAPVTTKSAVANDAVNRAKLKAAAFDRVSLSEATVAEVDADGDGKISFEELLRHDMKPGF